MLRVVLFIGLAWVTVGIITALFIARVIHLGKMRAPLPIAGARSTPIRSPHETARRTHADEISGRDLGMPPAANPAATPASLPVDALAVVLAARTSTALVAAGLAKFQEQHALLAEQDAALLALQRQARLPERLLDSLLCTAPADVLARLESVGAEPIEVARFVQPLTAPDARPPGTTS